MQAHQNQYTTMSAAATVAPIVLWSDNCQGKLYASGKNTFLEFYTDASKAIKRSACARSLSVDDSSRSSTCMTATTATPTIRSSSPSNHSLRSGSDSTPPPRNLIPSNHNTSTSAGELQTPVVTPRGKVQWADYDPMAMADYDPTMANGDTMTMAPMYYDGAQMMMAPMYYDGTQEPWVMMAPMMMMAPPATNEMKKEMSHKKAVTRLCNAKSERFPSKKQDLKTVDQTETGGDVTTLMLRGIPCSFSPDHLMKIIDACGLKGMYDFFYLPRAGNNGSNLGYAFVNFLDAQSAQLCVNTFNGLPLDPVRSVKICTISPGDIQGLANLKKHFHRTSVSRGSHGPVFPLERSFQ